VEGSDRVSRQLNFQFIITLAAIRQILSIIRAKLLQVSCNSLGRMCASFCLPLSVRLCLSASVCPPLSVRLCLTLPGGECMTNA
jgi:hypothetical protein